MVVKNRRDSIGVRPLNVIAHAPLTRFASGCNGRKYARVGRRAEHAYTLAASCLGIGGSLFSPLLAGFLLPAIRQLHAATKKANPQNGSASSLSVQPATPQA
ncbi:hypothetical protein [Paraburkholderia youngii]|uniref:hypothetical protein n=1 Tax=Paraburkholderia youngii TaxID=2782701 RepID=UPI0015947DE6|nr:hypothetical protein [Paraburkholderia youngii]